MRLQILLGGFLLAATALPAAASGGLECTIKDKSVRFTVNAGITSGMGRPTFNLKGELAIVDRAVAQDLRAVTFAADDRPQYWLDGKELRLVLYKERQGDKPFGSVELELRAKAAGDDGTFRGTYKLSTYDMSGSDSGEGKATTLRGKIACSVE